MQSFNKEYHEKQFLILQYLFYWLGPTSHVQYFTCYYCSFDLLPGDGDDGQDGEEDDHDTARDWSKV